MFTPMVMGLPNGMEWVILLVVALLLFGGSRLAGLGRGTGRAIREFKEETSGLREKDKDKELEDGTAHDEATAEQTKSDIADAEVVESRTPDTK